MDIVKEIYDLSSWANPDFGPLISRAEVLSLLERAGIREGFPIERVIALIECLSERMYAPDFPQMSAAFYEAPCMEARALHALIKPVDPDLLIAREMAIENLVGQPDLATKYVDSIRNGERDEGHAVGVALALAAIKRGRALASEPRP